MFNKRNKLRQELFFNLMEEDSAPNAFSLHCIWYSIAIVLLFVALQLSHICIVDNNIAMPSLISAFFILLIAEAFGYYTDHTKPWLKYALVLLATIAVTVVGIFLTYHTILASVLPLLIAAQYSRRRVIWFAYALSIISIPIIVLLGYKYGLSDANMVIQTISKSSDYGKYLSSEVLPLSERWSTILLFFALPRCLIITAFIPMINAIVINRKEILLRDVQIQYMGEHDHMTCFYNREKYTSMLKTTYSQLESVAVVFFDVNNLKLVNDTYGHSVGDELILRAADSIRNALKDSMDAYRLGGDEFMVVIPYGKESDAKALIEDWKNKLSIMNSKPGIVGCQIAYGFAAGRGDNFAEVFRLADKQMYDNKLKSKSRSSI